MVIFSSLEAGQASIFGQEKWSRVPKATQLGKHRAGLSRAVPAAQFQGAWVGSGGPAAGRGAESLKNHPNISSSALPGLPTG